MKKSLALTLTLLLGAAHAPTQVITSDSQQLPAQQRPRPTPTPAVNSDDDDKNVVRITTNLVQFDAVIKDSRGRLVTDLRPEDFEVFVGGRRQEVTNSSYISAGPDADIGARPAVIGGAPPAPSALPKPVQIRRTIALVADDLDTSWENMPYVRRALKKFVDEQMQPGDLVAVVRTSAGMGALQQFTSDKRLLYRAIEGVSWNPRGRGTIGSFAPIMDDPLNRPVRTTGDAEGDGGGGRQMREDEKALAEDARQSEMSAAELRETREQAFTVGALGALGFLMRAMGGLPGRKSVLLFSEGFTIYDPNDPGKNLRLREELRRLVDLANRNAVVVYPIDPRGVTVTAMTAEDATGGQSAQSVRGSMDLRRASYGDSQDPLHYMAQGTGGFFVRNRNDLGKGVQSVLDDQKGYYLIGFRPDESVFEPEKGGRRFNELKVKVKRPGMQVRARSGFLGVTEEEAKSVRSTPLRQLVGALASPFAAGDVPVRLTSLFVGDAAHGLSVNSLMHIDMSNVRFTEEADGWQKAVIDLFAITFGEGGEMVDVVNRTETVHARAEALESVRSDGLVYTMRVPVKKPGAYQLRIAVRDVADEKLGSASQYVEVPDLKKNRLALSGVVIQAREFAAANPGIAAGQGEVNNLDPMGNPAVRRFRQGMEVSYYFNIYNARLDRSTGLPRLQMRMRLFRDGRQIYAGPPVAFDPGKQADMKNLQSGTRLGLDAGFVPGEYLLQVVVTDLLAPEKQSTATQWTDFEIVK
jgi:VWFA-related protein